MYFLICSNVYDDVINFEVVNSWKTQKSKYLENEIQFFPLVKNSLIAS